MPDSGGSLLSLPRPTGAGDEFITDLHCPGCGSSFIRPAYRTGTIEKLLYRFHVFPFRCQLCAARFRAHWSVSPAREQTVDRREYIRLAASFQASLLADNDARMEGRMTEISMDGCTFESSTMLPLGSLLELVIKPASEEEPIVVETAVVCSVRPESMGFRFIGLQPADRRRLSQVILNLLVGQRRRPSKPMY
ncbi:MAG: PilZ domain-containing protein [Nitrospira sp.]|nr:PilZ domain-containing protein [Nitrospira sp.]